MDSKLPQSIVRGNWGKLKERDPVAANIMLEGLKLDFSKVPSLQLDCPVSLETNLVQSEKLEEFLIPWLEEGIVGQGTDGKKGYFSRLFTVPKDKTKLRPIIDLSLLNKSIKKRV